MSANRRISDVPLARREGRFMNIPLEFGRGILKKFRIFRQGTIL
jgi:hypothetical protein